MPSIGYLGPRGTFTQEALEANLSEEYDEQVPFSNIPDVLQAVQAGKVDVGIVPIENSIEGSVNITLDTLAFETDLLIEREFIHRINHRLVAKPGITVDEITGIVSHPHATAQCRRFISERFPDLPVTAANSTAEAAITVSTMNTSMAAIATELAARIYELSVLEIDIEDYPSNVTRFVLVGGERREPQAASQVDDRHWPAAPVDQPQHHWVRSGDRDDGRQFEDLGNLGDAQPEGQGALRRVGR